MFPDFPFADDHPNAEAHRWVSRNLSEVMAALEADAYPRDFGPLLTRAELLPPACRVAVLRASIERLPWYREHSASWKDVNAKRGTFLYELVCHLYNRKLPYTESDICEILRLSRHSCGHGSDVAPPFDILLAHARRNGITAELLDAVRAFLAGLKGVKSSKAWHLKRKGALLLLLDPRQPTGKRAPACWSDRFRQVLLALPPDELRHWQSLVLEMKISEQRRMPQGWRCIAQKFLAEHGVEHVVARLSDWWPGDGERSCWPIQTGGSHLLKHLVWLLEAVPEAHAAKPTCDELVRRLAFLDWKPAGPATKFQIAAAWYLAARPTAVAWEPLLRLAAVPGDSEGRIRGIVHDFSQSHGLFYRQVVQGKQRGVACRAITDWLRRIIRRPRI